MTMNQTNVPRTDQAIRTKNLDVSWIEMLDAVFAGFEPTGQAVERIIDKLEHQR